MTKANTVSARPASRVLVTQGPDTCVFTIPKLAQYLGFTNWRTEELLREGKIKFKWVGKKKMVHKRDADAWWDSVPYAQVEVGPVMVKNRPINGSSRGDKWAKVYLTPRTPGVKRVKFARFKSVGDEIVVCLANLK